MLIKLPLFSIREYLEETLHIDKLKSDDELCSFLEWYLKLIKENGSKSMKQNNHSIQD